MRALMTQALPLFERTNGVSVDIEFRLASAHKKAIEDGAAFDVAILPRPELDELAEHGAIARACTADRPRRAGRGANARYRQRRGALLQARSFAYSDGSSGAYRGPPGKTRHRRTDAAENQTHKRAWGGFSCPRRSRNWHTADRRDCPSRERNWPARCRPNCKMSSSTPPAWHRARNTALARDFIAFMATDQAKRRAASSQARPRRARLRANDRKRLRHRAFKPISA